MNFDLLIFDCDGVLVDSEALVSDIYSDFFALHNVEISSHELGTTYAGKADFDLIVEIKQRFTDHTLPDDAKERVHSIVKARMENELLPIDGVLEVLDWFDRPKCVCSNSGYKRLMHSLDITGILDRFDVENIYSASFVDNPKPAPDLHLLASKDMGFAPERCAVIEDSVTGIHAAKAAGMHAIGFTGAGHVDEQQHKRLKEAGADIVFSHMNEFNQFLKERG